MNSWLQIFLACMAVLIIVLVLIQQRESSLGSMSGLSDGDEIARTRRGAEKAIHYLTILLVIAFVLLCMYSLIAS